MNPRVPPRVLASGPKPCGGKKTVEVFKEQDSQCKVDNVLKWDVTKMQLRTAAIKDVRAKIFLR